jgi:hypothetical protein
MPNLATIRGILLMWQLFPDNTDVMNYVDSCVTESFVYKCATMIKDTSQYIKDTSQYIKDTSVRLQFAHVRVVCV